MKAMALADAWVASRSATRAVAEAVAAHAGPEVIRDLESKYHEAFKALRAAVRGGSGPT